MLESTHRRYIAYTATGIVVFVLVFWGYTIGNRADAPHSAQTREDILMTDNQAMADKLGLSTEDIEAMSDEELAEVGFEIRESVRPPTRSAEEPPAQPTQPQPAAAGGGNTQAEPPQPQPTPPPPPQGGSPAPTPQPPAVPAAPDVTITRNIGAEPGSASPSNGDMTLFQFTVDTPLDFADFEQAIFSLTLGDTNIDQATNTALQQQPQFHFERGDNGSWTRLVTTSYSRYSGSLRSFRYLLDYGERITGSATYRIVASNIPCSLAGNTIDLSLLDSRGNTNALFDTPTTQATQSVSYTEVPNPVRIDNCVTATPTPQPPQPPVSDITITRSTSAEPANAAADGDVVLYQFQVTTPHPQVQLKNLSLNLTLGNTAIDSGVDQTLADAQYSLEYKDIQGLWQKYNTVGHRTYSGSNRNVRFDLTQPIDISSGDELRISLYGVPCALAGNTLDVSALDSRGNPTFLFDTPDQTNTSDVTYSEIANPVTIGACTSTQYAPSNPDVWLRFEEFSGNLVDASGNANHANLVANLGYRQQALLSNGVLFQSGNASFAEIPIYLFTQKPLLYADPVTIEMLIRADQDGVWQGLVSKGNGLDAYDYHFAITPQNKLGFYTDQGQVWYEGTRAITKGAWTHVAMTLGNCTNNNGSREDCELHFYVNGRSDTINVLTGGNHPPANQIDIGTPSTHPVTIGAWSGSARLFSFIGMMDDLSIYNRVLSQSDIDSRYRGSR